MVAAESPAVAAPFALACERSWSYLQSWADQDGGLRGIIATHWDSSETCTEPHVMNQFPVIQGLCLLHRRFGNAGYAAQAERLAYFLVGLFDAEQGVFRNAWGDIPPKRTGAVHQAAAAGCLLELYEITKDPRLLSTAVASLRGSVRRWPGVLLNGVCNQALKFIEALLLLLKVAPQYRDEFAGYIDDYRRQLDALQVPVAGGGVLLDQSAYDSKLMTVYEAKCLHGLIALLRAQVHATWARQLLNDLVAGIANSLYVGKGLLVSHVEIDTPRWYSIVRIGAALLRRGPWVDREVRVERIRRAIEHAAGTMQTVLAPSWIARNADLAFVLRQATPWLDRDRAVLIREIDTLLLDSQLQHGGIPNAAGPWHRGYDQWERLVCCTRWNAYAFRYFGLQAETAPALERRGGAQRPVEWGDDRVRVTESEDSVRAEIVQQRREITWPKPGSHAR